MLKSNDFIPRLKACNIKENLLASYSNHAEGVVQIETGILLQTFNIKQGAKAPEFEGYNNPKSPACGC